MMQLNCNGLWSRLTELKHRLAEESPHVVLLQETNLRPGSDAPKFPRYNVAARQDHAARPGTPNTTTTTTVSPGPNPAPAVHAPEDTPTRTQTETTILVPGNPTPSPITPAQVRRTKDPRTWACKSRYKTDRTKWCPGCSRSKRCQTRRNVQDTEDGDGAGPGGEPPAPAAGPAGAAAVLEQQVERTTSTTTTSTTTNTTTSTTTTTSRTTTRSTATTITITTTQGTSQQPESPEQTPTRADTRPSAERVRRTKDPRTWACKSRYKTDREKWCAGCRRHTRCEARRNIIDAPPTTGTPVSTAEDPEQHRTPVPVGPPHLSRGGILTLVRDDLPYTEIKPYHPSQQDTSTYCTGTKVHFSREMNVNIINIYVPPARWSAGQGTQDQEFQPQGLQVDGNTILGGDVNAHSLSWDPYQPESRLGGTIEDWAIDNDMAILNDGSHTRQNPSTGGKSVPDLTLASRNLSTKMDWSTGEGCGSDHLPIYSRISPPTQRQRRKRRGRFTHKKADWDRFRNKLDELIGKWEVTPDDTLKKASDRLASTIISAAKHAIPFGNGRGRRPPFWNEECQTAVDEREAARKAANRTDRTRQDVVNHQEARAHADKVINEEKAAYFHQKVKEMKPDGDMWGLIKAMDGRVQHAKPAVTIDRPATPGQEPPQKPAVTDKEKAELFCQSYARVSRLPKTKETDHDITIEARKAGNCSCDGSRSDLCSPFSQNELRNALGKLKKGRSPGVDGVTNDMLHQLTTSARQELLKVLNRSWLEGEVPPSWRAAEIIAIPKKGKPLSETRSYRPISLLSCIGKLAERLVQNRLQHWLERSGRISPNQAGFRRGHSTVDQLTRITQTIFDGFERQKHHRAILVLLDYAQAYDRVWRNGLFAKMARIGIPGCATRWVRALLRDRRARVRWGETHSRWRVFQEGLPQGSVLALSCGSSTVMTPTKTSRLNLPQCPCSLMTSPSSARPLHCRNAQRKSSRPSTK